MLHENYHELSVFLFHRDLRLEDNSGLIAALKNSRQVIACFIFDPKQVGNNSYKSNAVIQFMIESLEDLQLQLAGKNAKLFLFYGDTAKIVEQIIVEKKVNAIYANRDYTPYSRCRDEAIAKIGKRHHVALNLFDDALLNPPEHCLKPDGKPYLIFSRFYEKAKSIAVAKPEKNINTNYYDGNISVAETDEIFHKILPKRNVNLMVKGGRTACLKQISKLKGIENYASDRDYPSKKSTTYLSPYLKFNICSVREVVYAIKQSMSSFESLLRELYWRDFFTTIGYYFPQVFGHAFQRKYEKITWENNETFFMAWCQGKTGFPIVDAGMRQLNETGYMHNRVRLITASFLVKDLHIDWRWGEKYFAQTLIDYDPAVNNGNWQWVASTGTDAQPYFRIFNPWLQQKKFDADCNYIKQWLPELKNLNSKTIHEWYKKYHDGPTTYPKPLIDHAIEAAKAKAIFLLAGHIG